MTTPEPEDNAEQANTCPDCGAEHESPWPWRDTNGVLTREQIGKYFGPVDVPDVQDRVVTEWLEVVSDLGDQAGINQGVQIDGDTVTFSEDFQSMLEGLEPLTHLRASLAAKVNAGVHRVGLIGENGITVNPRPEYMADPDIDALRASLGDDRTA